MSAAAGYLLAGLSAAEARDRLEREGANELPREQGFTLARVIFGVVREPMFALLIAAAAVYAIFGEIGESLLLLGFATVSVTIAVIQRSRSERALRGAARPCQSARAGDPRRPSRAHRRTRSGTWRRCGAIGG